MKIHFFLCVVVLFLLCVPFGGSNGFAAKKSIRLGKTCEEALAGAQDLHAYQRIFLERFLVPGRALESVLTSSSDIHFVSFRMIKEDLRGPLFLLEQLFHFYKDFPGAPKSFAVFRERLKNIEGVLGLAGDGIRYLHAVKGMNLDPRVISWLEARSEQGIANLEAVLIQDGWFGKGSHGALAEMIEALAAFRAPSQREDSLFILDMVHYLAWETETASQSLNMLVLDDFHKLRRLLRMMLLTSQMFRGKIELVTGEPVPRSLRPFQDVSSENQKYLVIDKSDVKVKYPIKMLDAMDRAQDVLCAEFGEIKDEAELHNVISEGYLRFGIYPNQQAVDRFLIPILKKRGWKPFASRSVPLHKKLVKSGLIPLYRTVRIRGE